MTAWGLADADLKPVKVVPKTKCRLITACDGANAWRDLILQLLQALGDALNPAIRQNDSVLHAHLARQ